MFDVYRMRAGVLLTTLLALGACTTAGNTPDLDATSLERLEDLELTIEQHEQILDALETKLDDATERLEVEALTPFARQQLEEDITSLSSATEYRRIELSQLESEYERLRGALNVNEGLSN